MAEPFRVLVVCTANSCRSPLAEHLLRAALRRHGIGPDEVEVASAGTRGYDGWPMDQRAVEALTRAGVEAAAFRSRALLPAYVAAADLVLAAERSHRDAVVALRPAALRTTFTIREFGWLLDGVATPAGETVADRARALVRVAADQRGARRPATPGDFDLADPVGAGLSAFEQTGARIQEALAPFVARLPGATPPSG